MRVTGDIKMLRDVTVTAILPLVANALVLVGMVVVMFFLDWQLALLAIMVLPLFALSTARLGRRIHEAAVFILDLDLYSTGDRQHVTRPIMRYLVETFSSR
jgi:ABC-type multidrug transport system fused ATPase/permease subunit